jgi:hypothetical protein
MNEKAKQLEYLLRAYEMNEQERQAEIKELPIKKGRQCLWKICSWNGFSSNLQSQKKLE